MNTFQLSAILFGAITVPIITFALYEYKKNKKMPKTSMFVAGLFCITLGIVCLLMTYELFSQDRAELFLIKHSIAFNKADHPIGFILCTALDAGLGLAFLGLAAIVIKRAILNKQ